MKKRKSAPEGGASWMDTYGDMVTLLLCFFVLLYSISTVDQAKWEMIVKSFNPDAKDVSQIVTEEKEDGNEDVPGALSDQADEDFDELFEKLKVSVEEAGLTAEVELYKGDGYTFVTFRDSIFFDGNSSVVKPTGEEILRKFSEIINGVSQSVKEIQVLGHTTQAAADSSIDVSTDRALSAERAANVTIFIQQNTQISPEKLVSVGYGQYRPIAPFDTEENRAKNRRVELIISKSGSVEKSLDEYYSEMDR